MPQLDWKVVQTSVIAGLTVLVPITLLSLWIVDDDSLNFTKLGFFGITMFGFAAAGYGAGKLAPEAPMAHGAIAGMGCWLIIQAFGIVRRIITGEAINPIGYPLLALMAATCGLLGAVFADWIQRSGRPVSVDELRSRLPK